MCMQLSLGTDCMRVGGIRTSSRPVEGIEASMYRCIAGTIHDDFRRARHDATYCIWTRVHQIDNRYVGDMSVSCSAELGRGRARTCGNTVMHVHI